LREIEEEELRANKAQLGLPKENSNEDGDAYTFHNPVDGPAEGEKAGNEAVGRSRKRPRVY